MVSLLISKRVVHGIKGIGDGHARLSLPVGVMTCARGSSYKKITLAFRAHDKDCALYIGHATAKLNVMIQFCSPNPRAKDYNANMIWVWLRYREWSPTSVSLKFLLGTDGFHGNLAVSVVHWNQIAMNSVSVMYWNALEVEA